MQSEIQPFSITFKALKVNLPFLYSILSNKGFLGKVTVFSHHFRMFANPLKYFLSPNVMRKQGKGHKQQNFELIVISIIRIPMTTKSKFCRFITLVHVLTPGRDRGIKIIPGGFNEFCTKLINFRFRLILQEEHLPNSLFQEAKGPI